MISERSYSVLAALHDSPAIAEAIAELVAHEIKTQIEIMRGYVLAGDIGRAQMAEGALRAYEDLPGTIAKHAKKFQPERV